MYLSIKPLAAPPNLPVSAPSGPNNAPAIPPITSPMSPPAPSA
ncbi:hypothetical protein [Bartonella sp. AU18XJBT]|nr:hypothetical protein [Bartonella sp. AU18XJBT]